MTGVQTCALPISVDVSNRPIVRNEAHEPTEDRPRPVTRSQAKERPVPESLLLLGARLGKLTVGFNRRRRGEQATSQGKSV